MNANGLPLLPPGALDGVRVVDMTTVLFGPYCTMWLGDMGADVIKVETLEGDSTRTTGPARHPGMAAVFLGTNRNKRSIALDAKRPEGREVLLSLIATANVFVTNVRPNAIRRLGLDYESVRASNPGLVYCKAVGYGQDGPYAAYPAFDDTIQAMSGSAALQAEFAGEPQYIGSAVADKASGVFLALATVAALRHAERTGQGQEVEMPMFEAMVSFNLVEHLYGSTYVPPLGEPRYPRVVSKFRRPYKTRDGYLAVVPYNDGQWTKFFDLIGRPELMREPRFSTMAERTRNIDALYELLADEIATRTSAQWLELLRRADIPAVPVKTLAELVSDDPHLKQTGFFREVEHPTEGRIVQPASPLRLPASPLGLRRHAPALGEHTVDILRELGRSPQEIERLLASGAFKAMQKEHDE
jgi:crotonobetainyl-CoA:carnitine CoA-transferase CaiB-like acyl-CoA transferase